MNTGEVIKAKVLGGLPFRFHYGIILVENGSVFILHNPYMMQPVKTAWDEFFMTRVLTQNFGKLGSSDPAIILDKFNQVKDKKYNLLTFNCEDFINYMTDRSCIELEKCFFKGKLIFWSSVLGLISSLLFIYWFLKKKK